SVRGSIRLTSLTAILSTKPGGGPSKILELSGQNGQRGGPRAADALAALTRQYGFGILGRLLGSFDVLLVKPIVLVLTILGRILLADQRPGVIDAAAIVVAQVLADRVDQQVPGFVFLEDRGPFVQQVPANELPVFE